MYFTCGMYLFTMYLFLKEWIQSVRLFRIMSIPTTFRLFLVLTSEQIGRRLPVFMLLLWQRQHIIVVDYK